MTSDDISLKLAVDNAVRCADVVLDEVRVRAGRASALELAQLGAAAENAARALAIVSLKDSLPDLLRDLVPPTTFDPMDPGATHPLPADL